MTGTRELAELLGQLPGLKALIEQYGGTNQGQIDARIALAKGTDEIALRALGASFDGIKNDTPAIQAMFDIMPRGGTIRLPALTTTMLTPLVIAGKPFRLIGSGNSYSASQGTSLRVSCADAFQITDSDGFRVSDMYIYAAGAAQTSGSLFRFLTPATTANAGMIFFERMRIVNFWSVWTLQRVFNAYFNQVTTSAIGTDTAEATDRSSWVLKQNGLSDDDQANALVAVGCTFGARPGTDMVVFDGRCGSAKFLGCSWGFGRHGIVTTNSTVGPSRTITAITASPDTGEWRITFGVAHGLASGSKAIVSDVVATSDDGLAINAEWVVTVVDAMTVDLADSTYVADTYSGGFGRRSAGGVPGFIYMVGGGMENIVGDGVRLEFGNNFQASNAYISTDGLGIGIHQLATYNGESTFNGMIVRAAGRDGIRLMKGYAAIDGCQVVNNGRCYVDVAKRDVTGAINNGAGLIRITSPGHGYNSGDSLLVQSVGGVIAANGTRAITVVDANTLDLQGTAFAGAFTTGGKLFRLRIAIANAVNNGAGLVRLTIRNHPFNTDDWLTATGGVAGNYRVVVIDANTVDLIGSAAASITATTGLARFFSSQIRVGVNARDISVTGGKIGKAAGGINRAGVGMIVEGDYTRVSSTTVRTPGSGGSILDVRNSANNSLAPTTLTQTSGTISPTVSGTTAGSVAVTYTTLAGSWQRVGDRVFWEVQIIGTPTALPTTAETFRLNLNGVPVAFATGAASTSVPGTFSAFAWPNTSTTLIAELQNGQIHAYLKGHKTGGSTSVATTAVLTVGTQFIVRVAGSYRAA